MRDITRNEFVPSLAPKSDLRGLENKLEHVQEQLALQMQSQNKAVHEDIQKCENKIYIIQKELAITCKHEEMNDLNFKIAQTEKLLDAIQFDNKIE